MEAAQQDYEALYYMDLSLRNDFMFLGELWECGEDVQTNIHNFVTREVKRERVKDPLYLAKFFSFGVKPAK